jgi:hypothetical protein
MAAIPGIGFTGSPGVDRLVLLGALQTPRTDRNYLYWEAPSGATSAAPARRHRDAAPTSGRSAIVIHTWQGLELPGAPMDYHFILQGAVDALWECRHREPEALADLETFAQLDLQLAEAEPHAVSFDEPAHQFVFMTSIARWISIVEREGGWHEALAIARRGNKVGQLLDRTDALAERVAALAEETP